MVVKCIPNDTAPGKLADVELHFTDGEVVGTATFTRRFVGPPGCVHGGVGAMIADQLVSCAPMAIGAKVATKSLTIRYLRPLPLDEAVELWAVCTPDGDNHRAKFEVFCRSLSDEQLNRQVPSSTWIVKDFISHLATIDGTVIGKQDEPLDGIAQLTHVAWPVVRDECARRRSGQWCHATVVLPGEV